ncbi:MAG TPA: carbohydrate kinase family protein [Streptosporangiaceae bacterium]|nr:carbohydrate kinase family protein [Streptosporangiaceae bacterium]
MDEFQHPLGNSIDWPRLHLSAVRRFSIAVIGEIRIDIRTQLAGVRFREVTADRLAFAPIDLVVSGTAVNFARPALEYFAKVDLIAKIGQDSFALLIRTKLDELGVTAHLLPASNVANGMVAVIHETGEDGVSGARLMIADSVSPGLTLTAEDIRDKAAVLRSADALFIDGYALLYQTSAEAICAAADLAHEGGALVCFDLVPHDIYQRIALPAVMPALERADVIVSQADTLSGMLGTISTESSFDSIGGQVRLLDDELKHQPLWLIRSGPHSIDFVYAYQQDRIENVYSTDYYSQLPPMGFGDRLTAGELYLLLAARATGSRSTE